MAGLKWPLRIVLVGCSAQKASVPLPAKDLYQGAIYQHARLFAERRAAYWYILSAEHGLLEPDTRIAPYDRTLAELSRAERRAWGGAVVGRLLDRHDGRKLHITLLAGDAYARPLHEAGLATAWGVEVWQPMAGLGIGRQKQWLRLMNEKRESEAYELAKAHGRGRR